METPFIAAEAYIFDGLTVLQDRIPFRVFWRQRITVLWLRLCMYG
jgi:hypothetical protein